MIVPVAGVKAMGIDLSGIEVADIARLSPEPENPYDPNAVAVEIHGRRVGYLQRYLAERFAAGKLLPLEHWHASVIEVLFFEGRPAGLRLDLTLAGGGSWAP